MQDRGIVVVRDIKSEFPVGALPSGSVSSDLRYLHEYAVLSSNIYEEDEKNRIAIPGWTHLDIPQSLPKGPRWHFEIRGLMFEVWCKEEMGGHITAVIVFRGTDATQLGDWISNLRWVTRYIPFTWDQYQQTRKFVPKIVEHIREKFGNNTIIVAAGHSLGGGLAQQAAYASECIKRVYAFDSSSVTGYYDIPLRERKKNCIDLCIYRVYEHGEILAYLRYILKSFYPLSTRKPKIVEIRYNLTSSNPIRQHSMKTLALELKEIAFSQSGVDSIIP